MRTPYYYFRKEKIATNYLCFKDTLFVDKLFYALKPNSEKEVLKVLNEVNANFEIASVGEFKKLKNLGVDSKRIICSLPIKPVEWLKELYDNGIDYFVFDNIDEYNKLKKYAPRSRKIMRIDINNIVQDTIEYGIPFDSYMKYSDGQLEDVSGITFYIAHNHRINELLKVLDYCDVILEQIGLNKIINIGGNYRLPHNVGREFYDILNCRLKELKQKHKCIIYAEPGRSIVKDAGSLITRVECVKAKDRVNYVYIDAGIPTGISYAPEVIKKIKDTIDVTLSEQTYNFYDITCSHRILFTYRTQEVYSVGDILELKDFGCYSVSKASQFHGWDLPAVVYKD